MPPHSARDVFLTPPADQTARLPAPAPAADLEPEPISRLPAMTLMALGGWVIIGWLAKSAFMVQFAPGLVAMVFNTALSFLVCGLALSLLHSRHEGARRGVMALGAFVSVLGVLVFLQDLGGSRETHSLIDLPGLHDWLHDTNPHPGRMAPNTALGFVLAGLVLLLNRHFDRRGMAQLTVVMSFAVLMLGITGLIGYSLKLSALYSWFNSARMAIHTAIGMSVLGLGLLHASLRQATRADTLRPDERIHLIGTLTLLTAALSTGLAGFVAMQERARDEITRGLEIALEGRQTLIQAAFNEGHERSMLLAASLAGTPELRAALVRSPGSRNGPVTALLTRRATAGKLQSIVLDTPEGKPLAEIGTPVSPKSFVMPIRGSGSQIIWDNSFRLRSTVPIRDEQNRVLATLTVVRAMPALEKIMMAPSAYGQTGEAGVCQLQQSTEGARVRCLPQTRQPRPYSTAYIPGGPKRTPMSLALAGGKGIFYGEDYRRHHVIAAYAPLGDTGIGMVLKQDSWEVFQPISEQLKRVLPIFLFLTAGGVWLLRSQVKPLASRLVRSETRARVAHRALADEECRIRAVLDNIGDGIITMDCQGIIRSVNPAACKIFGYTPEELVSRELAVLIPVPLRDRHREGLKRYLQQRVAHVVNKGALELPGLHHSGMEFPIELSVTDVEDDSGILFIGIVRDISERTLAQQALHDEKERLRVTLHSIGDAVITTDIQGRVRYLNPVAQEMTGWPKDEATGRHIKEVFHIISDTTGERAPCPVDIVLATGDISGLADHTELVRRNGQRIAIEDSAAPIRGQDGAISGVVIVFHDVTQQRRLAEQISYQASHDALTDLANRREFERCLNNALQKQDSMPVGASKGLSLLYLDLDQFKVVNDTCGHVAGDQLLIQVSTLMRSLLRSEDTLARLGGDEFAVLLENCPPEVAARVAENLRQNVHDLQFIWQDKSFTIGASIGLVSREGDQTLSDLLKAADSACYIAKEKGRNLVHVYRESDVEQMRRSGEMGWVARIERALRENRFVLYLQAIAPLDWEPGEPHEHYEVLIRMLDEEGGIVPPMAFIPAAERYGLMPRVDRWIVEHALQLLESRGSQEPRLSLSINLSATSVNQEDFLPFLTAQLTGRPINTADVCFEITETAAIASLTVSSRMMHELKALGCRFSLDDFGSGMSSFAYLKHLPVDYVKIDGSFVKDIEEDLIDRAMVTAINDIAHVMGIKTVAEFVENRAILERLRAIRVDYVQGYGIGRPVAASSIVTHTIVA